MTENLDWEKWSTFTHNRYVEEAERYSKPGSVAAKKAYFEAHYKRKAAERAAALVQEANANPQADGTLELEAQQRNYADSSSETSSNVQNVVAANEQPNEETFNYQVVECADGDQRECDAGQSDLDISNVEGVVDVAHALVNTNINLGSFTSIGNSNQFDHVEGNTNTGPVEEKMPDHVNLCFPSLFRFDSFLFLLMSNFLTVMSVHIYHTDAAGHGWSQCIYQKTTSKFFSRIIYQNCVFQMFSS